MKTETKAQRLARLLSNLSALGFTAYEANTLRRAQLTLHRWAELECGDGNNFASWAIERDEKTGKPFLVTYPHNGPSRRRPVADREHGALRRIGEIVGYRNIRKWARHGSRGPIDQTPGFLRFYHQTDPRGCALYLVHDSDIPPGTSIDSCYSNGLAVCA